MDIDVDAVCVSQYVAHGAPVVPASAYLTWAMEVRQLYMCNPISLKEG